MKKKGAAEVCYKNSQYSEAERVADLLQRMTIVEKCMQLRLRVMVAKETRENNTSAAFIKKTYKNGFGAFYATSVFNPERFNRIQRFLIENTRLGIPAIMMGESLHGCMINGATVFPQAIGLASSWNLDLMTRVAAVIGHETRAAGIRQTYAPNLDLSRDPRWGRVEENYGEDPFLTSRLGVAYVRALQKAGVAASPKHYCAHGTPEGGINLSPVHAGERELRELYLPPFAAAIREAGAMSLMPAYSELDGVPLHASRFLLTEILRNELGFDGFTVSDFGAITMLHSFHKVAPTPLDAGKQALWAGIDMEAPGPFGFGDNLIEAVTAGEIPEAWVDAAVERILRIKFRLGLFENPYADPAARAELNSGKAVALARRAAHETIVLLKNEANLLPISGKFKKIAIIGPNANATRLGDYTTREAVDRTVTVLKAFTDRIGARNVAYAPGCSIAAGSDSQIAEAVQAAKNAELAILVLGDNSNFHGGVGWGDTETNGPCAVTCGEGFDMAELVLPGRQQELLEAVAATGKPVVLVLMTGRPYAISWAAEKIPAILQAWYPGEQGGHAICDLLFGDVNPSGRLPISFPRSSGHIPCCYNHKVSARGRFYKRPGSPDTPGRDYVFAPPDALFPFGHGLSYTTFSYRAISAKPAVVEPDGVVEAAVTVKNSGKRAGAETVQLYLTDEYSRITPFVRRLRGFKKIFLKPGEQKRVIFHLNADDFSFINEQMQPEVEPGSFQISIGGLQCGFEVRCGGAGRKPKKSFLREKS